MVGSRRLTRPTAATVLVQGL